MNTLVRNRTLRLSKRFDHGGGFLYEPVDQSRDKIGEDSNYRRISASRRKVTSVGNISKLRTSLSYRRDRAKKRLIFLRSYKLGEPSSLSEDTSSGKNFKSKKLKKAANKVKTVAVSVVSFIRISSLRSYKSGFIRAFSQTRIQDCC